MAPDASIPSVLQAHFDQLQTLWSMRRVAVLDPACTLSGLVGLDERIEANTDGLLIGGKGSIPILEKGLGSDELSRVFASAYTMLRMKNQTVADQVAAAFEAAVDEALNGFLDAFCYGPIELAVQRLQYLADSAPTAVASIATSALVYQGMFNASPARMRDFMEDEDPRVRRCGWRIVALLDQTSSREQI